MKSPKDRLDILDVKSKYAHYLSILFKDEEFINEIKNFKLLLRSRYDASIFSVGYDFEFLQKMGVAIRQEDSEHMLLLAKKYRIKPEILNRYMGGFYDNAEVPINMIYHQIRPVEGAIQLKISPDITQEQFASLWHMVEICKVGMGVKPRRRNRGPNDYGLIYYIGKSITEGISLNRIYNLYRESALPGYHHDEDDRPYTLKEFKDYYEKYKFY